MPYCPSFRGVLVAQNKDDKTMACVVRCKSWYCPYCAEQNRKRWAAVLLDHVNKSGIDGWCWFTLTAHEKSHEKTGQYSLRNLSRAWDRLIKRMRRKYGKFEYCRVYERHESGAYHLHCIRSGIWEALVIRNKGKKSEYTDSKWLRKTARSLGLGYMTHASNLEGEKRGLVAFYVVKYMVKLEDSERESWGRVRRIQTSRGIKYSTKEKSEYNWEMKSGLWLNELDLGGEQIYLINEGRELNTDDFENGYVWPPDPIKV